MGKRMKKLLSFALAATMTLGCFNGSAVAATQEDTKAPAAAVTNQYRSVMYYGDWSIWGGQYNFYPKMIRGDLITHLNFAFLDFDANGNLKFTDADAATVATVGMEGITWGDPNAGILNAMQELRATYPNLKIGVSIGGWSKSNNFAPMAANATARANFVSNVMKFIKYCNMDFVDIDWEYPTSYRLPDKCDNIHDEGTIHASPADKDNFTLLMKDLRAALDKQGEEMGKKYELSCALYAGKAKLEDMIDAKALFDIIDFGNMMTYDLRGAWSQHASHQTPLYTNKNIVRTGDNDEVLDYSADDFSVDGAVQYLLDEGVPSEKIVIGCAFYTRGWEKVDKGEIEGLPGLYGYASPAGKDADLVTMSRGANNEAPLKDGEGGRRGGVWSYSSMDKLKAAYPDLQEYWDDEAKASYFYGPTSGAFFTCDTVRSIQEKTKYVKENNLGGCISWMASQDSKAELTQAIKDGLWGSQDLPEYEIKASPLDVDCTVKTYKQDWGEGGGFEISFKNNESSKESGSVLRAVETAFQTIFCPLLYIKTKSGATFEAGNETCGDISMEGDLIKIDLAVKYDSRVVKPGQTCTFKVLTSGEMNIDDIAYIELCQRIMPKSPNIASRQVIYGSKDYVDPFSVSIEAATTAPNPGEKVKFTAVPKNAQGAVSYKFILEDCVNEKTMCVRNGAADRTYLAFDKNQSNVLVEAEDGAGNKASAYVVINPKGGIVVTPSPTPIDYPEWQQGGSYNTGDIVRYNGELWEAQWWTNSAPGGNDGAWKKV